MLEQSTTGRKPPGRRRQRTKGQRGGRPKTRVARGLPGRRNTVGRQGRSRGNPRDALLLLPCKDRRVVAPLRHDTPPARSADGLTSIPTGRRPFPSRRWIIIATERLKTQNETNTSSSDQFIKSDSFHFKVGRETNSSQDTAVGPYHEANATSPIPLSRGDFAF